MLQKKRAGVIRGKAGVGGGGRRVGVIEDTERLLSIKSKKTFNAYDTRFNIC